MAKQSKTQLKIQHILDLERNFKKFHEKYPDISSAQLRKIRLGKIKPSRSEIGKINAYQIHNDPNRKISPEEIEKYIWFKAKDIKKRMKSKIPGQVIKQFYRFENKAVDAHRINRQHVYLCVIIHVNVAGLPADFELKDIEGKERQHVSPGWYIVEEEYLTRNTDASDMRWVDRVSDPTGNDYYWEFHIFDILAFPDLYNIVKDYRVPWDPRLEDFHSHYIEKGN